jgi:hypothetical protein
MNKTRSEPLDSLPTHSDRFRPNPDQVGISPNSSVGKHRESSANPRETFGRIGNLMEWSPRRTLSTSLSFRIM